MKTKRNEGRMWITFLCAVMMLIAVFIGKDVCKASTTKIPAGYTPIYTVEDLYGINDDLTGNYILMNDLDLSGTMPGGDWDAGNGWTPIGTNVSNNSNWENFEGVFDGNGYRIKNMTIYGEENNPMCLGLFASIWEGTVKNLALVDVNISVDEGKSFAIGGISGRNGGKIEECYVTGNIQCKHAEAVGGIVGDSRGNYASIKNCYSDVDIVLSDCFIGTGGGIVGFHYNGDLNNCYAIGSITLENTDVESKKHIGAIECSVCCKIKLVLPQVYV